MAVTLQGIKEGLLVVGMGAAGATGAVMMTPVFAPLLTLGAAGLCAIGGLGFVATNRMVKRDNQAQGHNLFKAVKNAASYILAAGATGLGLMLGMNSFGTNVEDALRDNVNRVAQGTDWRNLQAGDLGLTAPVRLDALTRPTVEAQAQNVGNRFMLTDGGLQVLTCIEFNVAVNGTAYRQFNLCNKVNVVPEKAQEFMRTAPVITAP